MVTLQSNILVLCDTMLCFKELPKKIMAAYSLHVNMKNILTHKANGLS